jgi:hypothetical protein
MGTITISHTRAGGTLLEGSCRSAEVADLVRPFGFEVIPSLDCLGIARSRNRAAQRWRIDGARTALEAAGWNVIVVLDDDTHPAVADPLRVLRRIDKLEADRRRVRRSLDRCIAGSPVAEELAGQLAELDEQLAHWRERIRQAEAEGFKVWSRADFQKGDFVRYRGTWYEVLRVNAKSLTIPHVHHSVGRDVVRVGDGDLDWTTWTAGYHDGVTGRMSPDEMRAYERERSERGSAPRCTG